MILRRRQGHFGDSIRLEILRRRRPGHFGDLIRLEILGRRRPGHFGNFIVRELGISGRLTLFQAGMKTLANFGYAYSEPSRVQA